MARGDGIAMSFIQTGMLILSLCTVATTYYTKTKETQFLQDHDGEEPIAKKRSISQTAAKGYKATQKLLSGATKMRGGATRYRKYQKYGDIEKALQDFYSVQPTNVKSASNFNFGRGLAGDKSFIGQVGDRRLILRPVGDKNSKGRPVMEIRSATDHIYDRIVYKAAE